MSSPRKVREVFTIHPQSKLEFNFWGEHLDLIFLVAHPWFRNEMVSFWGEVLNKSAVGGPAGAEGRRYAIRPIGFPHLPPKLV